MREDMSKVLVERPRRGHDSGHMHYRMERRASKQELRLNDEEQIGGRKGMKSHLRGHIKRYKKTLNENLNPLYRFLDSRLGQPWNDVYSEILSQLNLNNPVEYHVYQHLIEFRMVEIDTHIDDAGRVCSSKYGQWVLSEPTSYPEYYVHPTTGLLCKSPRKKKWSWGSQSKQEHSRRRLHKTNPLIQYWLVNGVWYEFGFRPVNDLDAEFWMKFPKDRKNMERFLLQLMQLRYVPERFRLEGDLKDYFGGMLLPISKRSVSTKELLRNSNDPSKGT